MNESHPYSSITFAVRDTVAVIELCRPSFTNSIDVNMALEAESVLRRCAWEDAVTAVVLIGSGNSTFSNGIDASEGDRENPRSGKLGISFIASVTEAILNLEKPVVAALNGAAAGVALQYALAADWRIGCARTRVTLSGENTDLDDVLNIVRPGWNGRTSTDQYMTYTRANFGIHECLRYGLVNEVVPTGGLLSCAVKRARKLALLPRLAFKYTKAYFADNWGGRIYKTVGD